MVNVTQGDRDAADAICNPKDDTHIHNILCVKFAAHRIATIEECAKVAEDQQKVFLSNEYSTGQPMSSFRERFACGRVAEEIRALKGE